MNRFLCWFLGHDWPGRGFEISDVWEQHGVWYLTASQQCQRQNSLGEQCSAKNTVRVLTHTETETKECPI